MRKLRLKIVVNIQLNFKLSFYLTSELQKADICAEKVWLLFAIVLQCDKQLFMVPSFDFQVRKIVQRERNIHFSSTEIKLLLRRHL